MEIKPESKGRGGRRPGAGRKPKARKPVVPPAEKSKPQERERDPDAPKLSRSDLAALRQALGSGWSVPDLVRNEALHSITEILTGPGSRRLKLSAARTLAMLDRVDCLLAKRGKTGLPIADLVAEAEAAAAGYRAETKPE